MDQKTADQSKILQALRYKEKGTTGGLEGADVWGDQDDVSHILKAYPPWALEYGGKTPKSFLTEINVNQKF